ncbi:MAG: glycosyltransferase family 1 protein, partial [Halanaerobiaceae bacterium]|nr:glycosyltransferase family 1 protein [Halanaerobiaceae bacterium]
VYTDNLPLNFDTLDFVSFLKGKPILTQSNYSIENTLLVGKISCYLYESSPLQIENKKEFIEEEILVTEEIAPEEIFPGGITAKNTWKDDCGGKRNIICISSTRWDFIRQRPHHLMELSSRRNNRVLFFNHSVAVNYEEAEKKLADPESWEERLYKVSESLWVFSPVHVLAENSGMNKDSLRYFNFRLKEEALRYLIYKLQFYDPIIISYLAESINYIKELPRKILCYDCIDEFSAFSWSEEGIEEDEEDLIREADLVITSAERLYKRIKKINQNTFLLPNAVEHEHFAAIHRKAQPGKKPVIGFIGAFYEWIDEELIEYLARMRKDWKFYFIGPVQPGMSINLRKLENVRFFGTRNYKELPRFLQLMDVCIIPFKQNRVTESANPIKLWEYMASGKPIVSTPIPEVKKFADIVYIGETKEEFLYKLSEALREDSDKLARKRIAVARRNDWNHRVEKLLKIIEDHEK